MWNKKPLRKIAKTVAGVLVAATGTLFSPTSGGCEMTDLVGVSGGSSNAGGMQNLGNFNQGDCYLDVNGELQCP